MNKELLAWLQTFGAGAGLLTFFGVCIGAWYKQAGRTTMLEQAVPDNLKQRISVIEQSIPENLKQRIANVEQQIPPDLTVRLARQEDKTTGLRTDFDRVEARLYNALQRIEDTADQLALASATMGQQIEDLKNTRHQ